MPKLTDKTQDPRRAPVSADFPHDATGDVVAARRRALGWGHSEAKLSEDRAADEIILSSFIAAGKLVKIDSNGNIYYRNPNPRDSDNQDNFFYDPFEDYSGPWLDAGTVYNHTELVKYLIVLGESLVTEALNEAESATGTTYPRYP
jgi:hypothetical protein